MEDPVYDWNGCISEDIFDRPNVKLTRCDKRCSEHKSCSTCLKASGVDSGWKECRWSIRLNEVQLY